MPKPNRSASELCNRTFRSTACTAFVSVARAHIPVSGYSGYSKGSEGGHLPCMDRTLGAMHGANCGLNPCLNAADGNVLLQIQLAQQLLCGAPRHLWA